MRRWCLSSSRRVSDGVACAVGTRRRHRPAAFCFSATVVSGGRHGFAVTRLYRLGRKKRGYRVDCCCAPKERGRRVRKELPSGLASGLVRSLTCSFSLQRCSAFVVRLRGSLVARVFARHRGAICPVPSLTDGPCRHRTVKVYGLQGNTAGLRLYTCERFSIIPLARRRCSPLVGRRRK